MKTFILILLLSAQGVFSITTTNLVWLKISDTEFEIKTKKDDTVIDTLTINELEKAFSIYKTDYRYSPSKKLNFVSGKTKTESIYIKRWGSAGYDVVGGNTFDHIDIYLENKVKIETLYENDVMKIKELIKK